MNFSEELILLFKNRGIAKTFRKGDFLVRESEMEDHLYFITEGAVRAFFMSEHDEHTIRLGYNDSFINSLGAFLSRKPSELYIEALRKTEVLSLHRNDLEELKNISPEHLKGYTLMMEQLVVQQIERELDLLLDSPNERLKRVLERSPNLFKYVPLKYIASYLRMKPETLSRIRKY